MSSMTYAIDRAFSVLLRMDIIRLNTHDRIKCSVHMHTRVCMCSVEYCLGQIMVRTNRTPVLSQDLSVIICACLFLLGA